MYEVKMNGGNTALVKDGKIIATSAGNNMYDLTLIAGVMNNMEGLNPEEARDALLIQTGDKKLAENYKKTILGFKKYATVMYGVATTGLKPENAPALKQLHEAMMGALEVVK